LRGWGRGVSSATGRQAEEQSNPPVHSTHHSTPPHPLHPPRLEYMEKLKYLAVMEFLQGTVKINTVPAK